MTLVGWARRRSTFARVKFLSRLFTALNLLPSTATLAFASRPNSRQSSTKCAHTLRMAGPLSFRKSAIVLWSGTSRPRSHITSKLRPASRSSRRLDCTQENRRVIGRPPRRLRLHSYEPQSAKIERFDERVDHTNRVVLVDPIIKAFRQKRRLTAIHPLDKALHPIPATQLPTGERITDHKSAEARVFTHGVIPGRGQTHGGESALQEAMRPTLWACNHGGQQWSTI